MRIERNPNASGGVEPIASNQKGLRERCKQLSRYYHGTGVISGLAQDDHELVSAEAGNRIARSQTRAEPRRDLPEKLIADRMAKSIVDHLEAIEIQHHHRDTMTAPPRAGQRLAQTILQQDAVRQT